MAEIVYEESWVDPPTKIRCRVLKLAYPQDIVEEMGQSLPPSINLEWWVGYATPPDGCPVLTDENVQIHGGITFPSDARWDGSTEWVGFDCNHYNDAGQWTREKVMEEVTSLARQIDGICGPVVMLAHMLARAAEEVGDGN